MEVLPIIKGRLGLESINLSHKFREPFFYIEHSQIFISSGCINFTTSGYDNLQPGTYQFPQQHISILLIGPGTSITHDVMRILNNQGTYILAVAEDLTKCYSQPIEPSDFSEIARRQTKYWSNEKSRMRIARLMFEKRFNEKVNDQNIETLRGKEGYRIRAAYSVLGKKYGVNWRVRKFDRKTQIKPIP
ncbi:MAG: hypothetical protein HC836_40425 [Richelia sp. RM2_1_2]|nr:hypothetical protein [Richelia sp. RM2_1_2]